MIILNNDKIGTEKQAFEALSGLVMGSTQAENPNKFHCWTSIATQLYGRKVGIYNASALGRRLLQDGVRKAFELDDLLNKLGYEIAIIKKVENTEKGGGK